MAKYNKIGGYHYHDLDPFTRHNTKSDAMKHRTNVFNNYNRVKSRYNRVPTFYSYMHTKPTAKVTRTPQGPHTFPHHGLVRSVMFAHENNDYSALEQVIRTPTGFTKAAKAEIPDTHSKAHARDRAINAYKKHHGVYSSLIKKKRRSHEDNLRLATKINKMLQMDPYGAFSYKSATPASKRHTKGSGESAFKPVANQVQGRGGFFNHPKNYDIRINQYLGLSRKSNIL